MSEVALIDTKKLVPAKVFSGEESELETLLATIEKEVRSHVPDLETNKGREAIASLSHKVSKSKVALDNMGKDLAADMKSQISKIDSSRKVARDRLELLRDEARKPLTEWEEEQKKIAAAEAAAVEAKRLARKKEADHELAVLMNEKIDGERKAEAERIAAAEKEEAERIAAAEKAEAERIEKERIASEAAAAEKARKDAEEKAAAEIARVEKERKDAEEKAAQAERDKIAAEERAKIEAEQAKIREKAAKELAERNAKEAAERAKQKEIDDRNAKELAERQEYEAREANKKHVGKLRCEAKQALMKLGMDEDLAKKIVLAIHNQEIPNVSIKY